MQRVFIVRHGESKASYNRGVFGKENPQNVFLSEWGWKQSLWAGETIRVFLQKTKTKELSIFFNDHSRIIQTASAIQEALIPIRASYWVEDERLCQRQYGILDGLSPNDQKRLFPKTHHNVYEAALETRYTFRPEGGGESLMDLTARLRNFCEYISLFQSDIVICNHGYTCFLIEKILCGMSDLAIKKEPIITPPLGSVTLVENNKSEMICGFLKKDGYNSFLYKKTVPTYSAPCC